MLRSVTNPKHRRVSRGSKRIRTAHLAHTPTRESQSKPGTKMVCPELCKELPRRPHPFMAGIVPCPPITRALIMTHLQTNPPPQTGGHVLAPSRSAKLRSQRTTRLRKWLHLPSSLISQPKNAHRKSHRKTKTEAITSHYTVPGTQPKESHLPNLHLQLEGALPDFFWGPQTQPLQPGTPSPSWRPRLAAPGRPPPRPGSPQSPAPAAAPPARPGKLRPNRS